MMTDLVSAATQSLAHDPMVGLRLARVDGFEPAVALGSDELPAYLRRFTMLFADDATMRRRHRPRDACRKRAGRGRGAQAAHLTDARRI